MTPKVEIAIATNPDPQTWTDISAYVRSVTTRHGRDRTESS